GILIMRALIGLSLSGVAAVGMTYLSEEIHPSFVLAACCSLLSTMMTSWHGILIMRALIGLSLSGVAAVGMTYLSEEIHPSFV
ncbi:MFS transporter, partial [Klebsiella pneumoniae]